jgi:hypothetical protein
MHPALLLLQTQMDPEQARKIAMMVLAVLPVVILVGYVVIILPCWFICKKAGLSPWLALINLVPLGNVILLYVLAFTDWKVAPVIPQALGYAAPPAPPRP